MRNINEGKNEHFYGFHSAYSGITYETSSPPQYFDLDIRPDRARDINRESAG